MTGRQSAFITALLGDRQVDAKAADRIQSLITTGQADKREASRIIGWLLDQPKPPRQTGGQPAEVGVYQHDGDLYVVREFTPQGETRKVRYARRIVALTGGQGDRLDTDGDNVRYQEVKAAGMQWTLQASELVPVGELSRLGIQFGRCIVCGAKLEVADSVKRGVGPVCADRQFAALELAA